MSVTPESDGFFFKSGSWSDDTLAFCRKLEHERDEAREIIRMAKAKFCEEGSDGNIASEMFSILSGGK